MLDPRALDVIIVRGKIDIDEKMVDYPLDLSIQVTVNLGPIGAVKTKEGDPVQIPRFASNKTAEMTVFESTSASTTFLVPYAVITGTGGYDTGFSIANTTSGDNAQTGSVTFSFPGDPTLDEFESEMVGPRENVTLLLSEILGPDASYTGQVMITANFTDGEGVAFVSNFRTFHLSIAADQGVGSRVRSGGSGTFPVIRAVLRSCDSGQEGQERGGSFDMAPPFLLANCPDLPATTWVARIMTYRTGAGSPGMGLKQCRHAHVRYNVFGRAQRVASSRRPCRNVHWVGDHHGGLHRCVWLRLRHGFRRVYLCDHGSN